MTTQKFFQSGDIVQIKSEETVQVYDSMPQGVWKYKVSMSGPYYERNPAFEYPPKYYGNLLRQADKVIHTWHSRYLSGKSTGVLLSGIKGAGKTQLAKEVARQMQERFNAPTILVDEPWSNDDFRTYLCETTPSVVIFDEFEKIYNREGDQHTVLSLLDGVYPTKHLYFVIVNDKWKLTDALKARPGRLFYHFVYDGLESQFILDYCKDKLQNQENTESLVKELAYYKEFTFDQLQCLVEEMNRYSLTAAEAIKDMNILSDWQKNKTYTVKAIYKGLELPIANRILNNYDEANFTFNASITMYKLEKLKLTEEDQDFLKTNNYLYCTPNNIVSMDMKNQIYKYLPVEGIEVIVTREDNSINSWITQNGVLYRPSSMPLVYGEDED